MKRIGTLNGKTIVETSDLNTLKDNEVAIRYDGDKLTLLERNDNEEIVEISGKNKKIITVLQEDLNKSGHPEEFSEGIQKLVSFFNSIPNEKYYLIDEIIDKAPLIYIKDNTLKYYISSIINDSTNITATFITDCQYLQDDISYTLLYFNLVKESNTLTTKSVEV